jgi:hypothetical protein
VTLDGDTMTVPGVVRLATFYDPDGCLLIRYLDLSEQG